MSGTLSTLFGETLLKFVTKDPDTYGQATRDLEAMYPNKYVSKKERERQDAADNNNDPKTLLFRPIRLTGLKRDDMNGKHKRCSASSSYTTFGC